MQALLCDNGYVGRPFAQAVQDIVGAHVGVQIAKRSELHTFKVMPQRWVVECSFAWLEKNRRLSKNCERLLNTSLQFIHLATRRNARNLAGATGCFTTLRNYPRGDQNVQYLLTSVTYHFTENVQVSDASKGSTQRFAIEALPTSRAFRPARITPKPRTQGLQTAWVVGPPGEEIYCDKFGRVKVQFHWGRIGAMNEKSSCWMRFSSSWAGANFGAIAIPRIGMEVLVDHIDANPDRPIIVGVVYNADNMPPWQLPGNQTQTGIKTRSSKGGASGPGLKNGPGDANVLRFEDKAGQEQLWIHAQKDQLTEVENDEDKWVGRGAVAPSSLAGNERGNFSPIFSQ